MLERVRELEQLTATTQRELEQSNERMQALLQSAGDGVLGLDADGMIDFANPRAGSLLESDRVIGIVLDGELTMPIAVGVSSIPSPRRGSSTRAL